MSSSSQTSPLQAEQDARAEAETNPELYQHFANLVSSLPSSEGLSNNQFYRHDQGWYSSLVPIVGAMVADACFTARPSDIVVATLPKSGTTWIKSFLHATVRRREHHPAAAAADHPLISLGPHGCIKFFEYQLYTRNKVPDLDKLPDPRLFATHLPFVSLPRTVVTASGCKIVYVCRDPKDHLISQWHFANKFRVMNQLEPLSFDAEEEESGVVDAIVRLCSFEHMGGGLEVTKSGRTEFAVGAVENSSLFRRGGVGDWANHLSLEAARRIAPPLPRPGSRAPASTFSQGSIRTFSL
ncbi:Sulfotransferase 17 [Panicum miliaceum]|uniref:Sulfotransferase n=1 Tax=Panicum miliaceum TaxID=4540 RepID=A0A3L6Q746_PANMI|nr:Sulfotransferase 17 [Panicum miliaceum]